MAFKDDEHAVISRLHLYAAGGGPLTREDAWSLLGTLDRTLSAELHNAQIKYQIQELARDAGVELEIH